jgi:hypothetical protein
VLSTLGHGSVAVYFDDKWNWMDAFIGGCLWDQERKHLATLPEIVAQPALLKRENPSPVPLFPCGKVLLDDALRFEPGNEKYHKECGPDDADWATRSNPGKCERMDWPDKSSLAIVLRPGETYTRSWDHEPGMYFLFKTAERLGPPHHFCGVEAEGRDTVNWPYWKPYVKEITSTDPVTGKPVTVKTGRYWANGRLTWHPDLAAAGLLDSFASARNARVDAAAKAIVPVGTLLVSARTGDLLGDVNGFAVEVDLMLAEGFRLHSADGRIVLDLEFDAVAKEFWDRRRATVAAGFTARPPPPVPQR